MAVDGKYGRVTTEHGDIGADEPVIVFRAQDGLLPEVLAHYWDLCKEHGSPDKHLNLIHKTLDSVEWWQAMPENYVKFPPNSDGPAGRRLPDED